MDCLLNGDGALGRIALVRHSPGGTWLATVSIDSCSLRCAVWDLQTAGPLLALPPITIPPRTLIASLSWARNDLLVATAAGQVFQLPVSTNQAGTHYDASLPEDSIVSVYPHPRKHGCWVACYRSGLVASIDYEESVHIRLRTPPSPSPPTMCCCISEEGLLFLGSQSGAITVFDVLSGRDLPMGDCPTLGLPAAIQHITVHPGMRRAVLVLKDRTIRVLDCAVDGDEGDRLAGRASFRCYPRHRLQDAVDRWQWGVCGFSYDGELVWGTVSAKGLHRIYLWDTNRGALIKTLEGPKEDLVAAEWNPKSQSILTVSSFGAVLRWSPDYPVTWSALVPGLHAIEENVEYVEREDEFDFVRPSAGALKPW